MCVVSVAVAARNPPLLAWPKSEEIQEASQAEQCCTVHFKLDISPSKEHFRVKTWLPYKSRSKLKFSLATSKGPSEWKILKSTIDWHFSPQCFLAWQRCLRTGHGMMTQKWTLWRAQRKEISPSKCNAGYVCLCLLMNTSRSETTASSLSICATYPTRVKYLLTISCFTPDMKVWFVGHFL